MSKTPIPASWFRRLLFRPAPRTVGVLGFTVRFPGSTPPAWKRWLREHGYVYGSGRAWHREDRKPSRMTRAEADAHADVVHARRRYWRTGEP